MKLRIPGYHARVMIQLGTSEELARELGPMDSCITLIQLGLKAGIEQRLWLLGYSLLACPSNHRSCVNTSTDVYPGFNILG